MPTEVLNKHVTGASVFSFKSAGYSPTAANDIDPASSTAVDLTLDTTSGVADGAAMNSDQVDLTATHAEFYAVRAALEWFSGDTPVVGSTVDLYWSPSNNSNVGDGNPGKPDGVDGDYTGDGGGTVAESVAQMQYIGSFLCTDLVGVQIAEVGVFRPNSRYGQLVVVNNSGVDLAATNDDECCIVMEPFTPEIQN